MSPFSPLLVPDELLEATSAQAWLAAMLDGERALAVAGARAGVIPQPAAGAIAEACDASLYDWDKLVREGRKVGQPAEPLVRALVERVGDENARWVHLGATSQDIMDTAAMLVVRRALELILAELDRVIAACAALARTHRDTPMAGRTLLQQAVPTTFGLKAAGWLTATLDARARLVQLRTEGLAAQLGGAAGTLSALGKQGLEVSGHFADELGLAEAVVPWHTNRVRIAELGAALAIAAGSLAKIGLDIALLAQTEVGEVSEGAAGGISSAMPQKRNPIGAALTRTCASLATAQAEVLVHTLVQEHERAAGSWQAEGEALSGALAYTGGAAASLAGSLEGLEVDETRMRENLALTGGQVAAERLALILTEQFGRTPARAIVREASLRAGATGRSLAEELADVETGLTPDQLEAALEPTSYLGSAGALVDRALARYNAEATT